jgi:hypothetical protein
MPFYVVESYFSVWGKLARQLAICAAKFDPTLTPPLVRREKTQRWNLSTEKSEGPLRGQ